MGQPTENAGIKPFAAFNTLINVLMGTGPILLPPTVAAAGFGFGVICLVVMCVFSMAACEFIVESLSIANCIQSLGNGDQDNINKPINAQNSVSVSEADLSSQDHQDQKEYKYYFEMKEQFEYGSLSKLFYGRKGEIFSVMIVVIYLYGALISKGIIVGTSLSLVFSNIQVLDNFYFWVILFFIASGILSFKDISSISLVQTIIAIVRYITIVAMLIGSSIIMVQYKVMEPLNWFNVDKLPQLLSTTIFAYLMHHSSPSMLRPIQPQSAIRAILSSAFVFGACVFLIIPLTGIWAFPGLDKYCYYNSVFNQQYVNWAYYIISFYMFLNIAALPVLTITIRKNMMKLFVPHLMPKSSFEVTKATAGFTLLIIVPCAMLALVLRDDIELVIGFTGGICGVLILLIVPPLLVYKARKLCPLDPKRNPFKSVFYNNAWVICLLVLGIAFIPYNLYIQINKLVNGGTHCQNSFNPDITHY